MKSLRARALFCAVTFVILGAHGQAHAAVIFSNFGPGDEYEHGGGATLSDRPSIPSIVLFGNSFTPVGNDYLFDSATLAAFVDLGPSVLDVFLMTDAAGAPGTIMESIYVSNAVGPTPVEAHSVVRPTLHADTQYWLVVGLQPESLGIWFANSIGDHSGSHATMFNGSSWIVEQARTAFSVSGTVVPETAGMSCLAMSGLCLVVLHWFFGGRRGQKNAPGGEAEGVQVPFGVKKTT